MVDFAPQSAHVYCKMETLKSRIRGHQSQELLVLLNTNTPIGVTK